MLPGGPHRGSVCGDEEKISSPSKMTMTKLRGISSSSSSSSSTTSSSSSSSTTTTTTSSTSSSSSKTTSSSSSSTSSSSSKTKTTTTITTTTTTTHGSETLSTVLMQVAQFSVAAVRQFHRPVYHNY